MPCDELRAVIPHEHLHLGHPLVVGRLIPTPDYNEPERYSKEGRSLAAAIGFAASEFF